jgi:hypothetical protein
VLLVKPFLYTIHIELEHFGTLDINLNLHLAQLVTTIKKRRKIIYMTTTTKQTTYIKKSNTSEFICIWFLEYYYCSRYMYQNIQRRKGEKLF